MIEFQNVSVMRGGHDILDDVSFRVNKGDRVGFVGPNGAGKTTIFALLTGEIEPDRGNVTLMKGGQIGYLRQILKPTHSEQNLLDYTENALPAVQAMQHRLEALEAQVSSMTEEEREKALREMGRLQTDFENSGGYELSTRAQQALAGLGFTNEDFHKPFDSFSGGWQMRAELCRALVGRPDLLLLDEPTNFLDIPAVEWLQKFLREFEGTLVLISHDRFLLNSLAKVTYEVAGGRVTRYPGNFDYYERERIIRYEQALAAKKNQDRKREQLEDFIERFKAKNTKAAQAQSRARQLEKMEAIVVPMIAMPTARLRVAPPPPCGVEVMRLEDAGLTYDGTRWVLRHVDVRIQRGEKIGLIGLNGLGKTTLLRMLAGVLPLSEGKRVVGHKVAPGYQAQDFAETMDPERTCFETLKAVSYRTTEQQIRNLLGSFLFSGDDIDKPIGVLSGGEKMRVAFARLLLDPPNFLLLDEPTTHLDIGSREMLERALQDYEGSLCLVSHDIEFVRRVATNVIAMTPPGITRYYGGYDYYHSKTAQERAEEEDATPDRDGDDKGPSKKDLRRERAEKRKGLRQSQIPLERTIRSAEARIAALEKEQKELLEKLMLPEAATDYARINKRLSEIEHETHIETGNWERASLALEASRKEAE